ncbi:MAG: chemotaxis protein CheW [Nitrospinae bacterium]|nr:chemotaxis protein CheW [Nitrospinota bacterium]
MGLDDSELLNEIILESKEHLSRIEPDLLSLEKNLGDISADLVNRLFRTMHSIKGGFAFMGLLNISSLAHSMENALARLRDGQIQPTPELVDALLAGVDKTSELLDNATESESISTEEIKRKLAPFTEGMGEETSHIEIPSAQAATQVTPPVAAPAAVALEETAVPLQAGQAGDGSAKDKPGQSKAQDAVRVKVSVLDRLMNLAAEMVFARNQMMSALNIKTLEALDRGRTMEIIDCSMDEARRNMMTAFSKLGGGLVDNGAARDTLGQIVGKELDKLKQKFLAAVSAPLNESPHVKKAARQVNFVTSELQESVMGTRLQPVGAVFGKLPRIIRDLTRSLKKEINIEVVGEEVELDKSIIEALSDPLTHIIRNCADHGIEMPEAREKAGKNPAGHVRVAAYHEGGQVYIEIEDDGKGIDPGVVKRKALEKGLITPEQAGAMSDTEAQRLIFAPGFSTAQAVTDVSGRGVGMDVVRTNIEDLGGSVELGSSPGRGTKLILKLPLTMAIMPALIVVSEGRRYAIPQANIDELVRVRGVDSARVIEKLGDAAVIRRQGRLLPLVYLTDLFGLKRTFPDYREHARKDDRRATLVDRRKKPLSIDEFAGEFDETDVDGDVSMELRKQEMERRAERDRRKSLYNALQIIVLKVESHRFGLIVDSLLDTEEIVVKPLSAYLKGCGCYSGATIMGDGKVVMILDPSGIAAHTKMKFDAVDMAHEAAQKARKTLVAAEKQSLLLFRAGREEVFAINIDLVGRIEEISAGKIKSVGDKEFLNYADHSMRILRLENFLPINRPQSAPEKFSVIIPKLVRSPMGIVASEILDVVKSDARIDRDKVKGIGIFGSGVIDERLVIFMDIYSLYETAEPEIYKNLASHGKLTGKKILLAEDTAFFRMVTTKYLEEQGLVVKAVTDGQYAWETLCAGERFDLLITDVNMPRMNGIELTRKVRSSGKFADMPIVALTSMGLDRDKKTGLDAGVDYYELKLDKERLLHALRKVFGEER